MTIRTDTRIREVYSCAHCDGFGTISRRDRLGLWWSDCPICKGTGVDASTNRKEDHDRPETP